MKSSKLKNRFLLSLRKCRKKMKSIMDSKEENLSDVQVKAFSITRKLIAHPNSLLVPAPISGTNYVDNSNYLIRFSGNSVTITNGKFSYYVWLPNNKMDLINETFNRSLEKKTSILQNKYDSRTVLNLSQIETDITVK